MDVQQGVPLKRSIKTKFSLLICVLVVIILVGNWYSFQISKNMIREEMKTRGISTARNLSYSTYHGVISGDKSLLNELSEDVLLEDDLRYVVILDKHDNMLVSKSKYNQRSFTLPEAIRYISCDNRTPVVNSYMMDDERLYNVGIRIIRQNQNIQIGDNTFPESGENRSKELGGEEKTPQQICLGTVHIGMSLKNMDSKLNYIMLIMGLVTIFVGLIGAVGSRILSQTLVNPILRIAEVAIKISKGDLRQTIEVTSNNEVGVLEAALSQILQSLNMIATRLQNACEQIKLTSDEILRMSEEQATVSQRQAISIYQIAQTIEDIAKTSKHISNNAGSVVEAAESTLQSTQKVEKTVRKTIAGMEEIHEQVGKNTERVVLLGEKIAQINNVVKIINTIADQTKLIAFNASIEAAGAGEAGGRFSIVATEVRRLANTVVESVEEIGNSVSSIQTATSELTLSSETGIRKVNQGAALITEIGNTLQEMMTMFEKTTKSAKEISDSMQKQQTDNELIVNGIEEISGGSEQSVETSKKTNEIAKELRTLAEELDATVHQFVT
jgi:methyl-accepting chemotaxis protein